jgi:hypothetical protein
VETGDAVVVRGSVADHEGDLVAFEWTDGSSVLDSGTHDTDSGGAPSTLPGTTFTTGADADLALGLHELVLEVEDSFGDVASCDVEVNVIDTEAPVITASANLGILWPVDHRMRNIVIEVDASDASRGSVTLSATVSSTEDPLKDGSGQTIPDWTEPVIDQETGTITLQLRAERSGNGPGRTYTVTITATDGSGNTSTTSVTFEAPHDQRRR